MPLPAIFDEVGITIRDIERAIGETAEIREAIMNKAKEVRDYWQSIAPVGPKEHTLKSGYVDQPGDYRDSIRITYQSKTNGFFTATVGTNDYKAKWLEYGSIHNPEYGFAQKTLDYFGGSVIRNSQSEGYILRA